MLAVRLVPVRQVDDAHAEPFRLLDERTRPGNQLDLLDPFLVTVVTPTDQWMYVSSSGALTAGRRSAGEALFPYETDDRLHRAHEDAGGWTCLHVTRAARTVPPSPVLASSTTLRTSMRASLVTRALTTSASLP